MKSTVLIPQSLISLFSSCIHRHKKVQISNRYTLGASGSTNQIQLPRIKITMTCYPMLWLVGAFCQLKYKLQNSKFEFISPATVANVRKSFYLSSGYRFLVTPIKINYPAPRSPPHTHPAFYNSRSS